MTESFITLGTLRSYTREGHTLILDYGGPCVAITVLTDRLIRGRLAPGGTFAAHRSWAVARADNEVPGASFEIEDLGQVLVRRTASFRVRLRRRRGKPYLVDEQAQQVCDQHGR